MSTQKYSEFEQSEIRNFFYNDVPTFPFPIKVQPITEINAAIRRDVIHVCESLADILLPAAVATFIKNISADPKHEALDEFEVEIVSSHAYFCLMHIVDIYKNMFERSVIDHAYQYIQLAGYVNQESWEGVRGASLLPVVVSESDSHYSNFGSVEQVVRFVEQSDKHTICIEASDGDDIYLPLSNVLSYKGVTQDALDAFLQQLADKAGENAVKTTA